MLCVPSGLCAAHVARSKEFRAGPPRARAPPAPRRALGHATAQSCLGRAPRSAEASDAAAGGRDSTWAILPRLHWLSPTTAVQEVRRRFALRPRRGCLRREGRSAMARVGARALRGAVIARRNIRDGMHARARARSLGQSGSVGIVDAARLYVFVFGRVCACLLTFPLCPPQRRPCALRRRFGIRVELESDSDPSIRERESGRG
jgi:hypothetical protein